MQISAYAQWHASCDHNPLNPDLIGCPLQRLQMTNGIFGKGIYKKRRGKKREKWANGSTGQLTLSAFPLGLHRGLKLPACGCVGD
jgi:hypothetical protein